MKGNTRKTRKYTRKVNKKGGMTREEMRGVEVFRNKFINKLKDMNRAVKSGNELAIKSQVELLISLFENNQQHMNTLILMNRGVAIMKGSNPKIDSPQNGSDFYPLMVPVFRIIKNIAYRVSILDTFMQLGGNLRQTNYRSKNSLLSDALERKDMALIQLLRDRGIEVPVMSALRASPSSAEQLSFKSVERSPKAAQQSQKSPKSPKGAEQRSPSKGYLTGEKFILREPQQYNSSVEPEFWKPVFADQEMTQLRKNIQKMMQNDCKSLAKSAGWSICKINKQYIPTYSIAPQVKEKEGSPKKEGEPKVRPETDQNYTRYNIMLCAALVLFGILTKRMENQDFFIVLKGGKAIQLALSEARKTKEYLTEDIDILLIPKGLYEERKMKIMAGHISYLVEWMLDHQDEGCPYGMSVMPPDPEKLYSNQTIYKLSYIKDGFGYKAFSDIDFGEIPQDKIGFFTPLHYLKRNIPELKQEILLLYPSIESLMNEKVFYYGKYFYFRWLISTGKIIPGIHQLFLKNKERATRDECEHFMKKFKPAIIALNEALSPDKDRFQIPKFSIRVRLAQCGYSEPNIDAIIQELYKK